MKSLLILGAGGHSKVLIEIIRLLDLTVLGILDDNPDKIGLDILGIPVIGNDTILHNYLPEEVFLVNGIGSTRCTIKRSDLFNKYKQLGYKFCSLVHPSSIIARDVNIGEGTQVMAGVVIQPGCSIGDNSIINTRAAIDHDCSIGDHVHIAPGVTLSGGVSVQNHVHVGTGAVIIQGISLGNNCTVAAGTVVIRDIPNNTKVMGVPGKVVGKE